MIKIQLNACKHINNVMHLALALHSYLYYCNSNSYVCIIIFSCDGVLHGEV